MAVDLITTKNNFALIYSDDIVFSMFAVRPSVYINFFS